MNKYEKYLYPNTPIEIKLEMNHHKFYVFSFYEEGVWVEEVEYADQLRRCLMDRIRQSIYYWAQPTIKMQPDWHGWDHISEYALTEIANEHE